MSGRPAKPANKITVAKLLREHLREWANDQNADQFKDCPIPEPRTIGQQFDQSGGVRMTLEVPAQPVDWRHDGSIMVGTPPKGGGYQFLHDDFAAIARNENGMMALVEGLRALALNPEITGGEESGAFITGLLSEVEGRYSGELLAMLPSVAAAIRVGGKHKKTNAVKESVLIRCEEYRKKHPTHGNTKIAREMKKDAFLLNAAGMVHPFKWEDETDAYEAIKGWLTPSKSK